MNHHEEDFRRRHATLFTPALRKSMRVCVQAVMDGEPIPQSDACALAKARLVPSTQCGSYIGVDQNEIEQFLLDWCAAFGHVLRKRGAQQCT